MGVTQIKEWFIYFKDGCMSVDSDQHSGRPSMNKMLTSLTKLGHQSWMDRRLTVQEIAYEVWNSRGFTNTILTEDLGM
jgi:hypothetical protein